VSTAAEHHRAPNATPPATASMAATWHGHPGAGRVSPPRRAGWHPVSAGGGRGARARGRPRDAG
jgi:hypothetical protein